MRAGANPSEEVGLGIEASSEKERVKGREREQLPGSRCSGRLKCGRRGQRWPPSRHCNQLKAANMKNSPPVDLKLSE